MLSTSIRSLRSWLLIDIGGAYLVLGLFSLFNAFIQWKLGGPTTGQFLMYGLLYVPLAYLFFTRQRWLLWLVGLNLIANILVWSYRVYLWHTFTWLPIVIVGLNALVFWLVWHERATFRDTALGRVAAFISFGFWLLVLATAIQSL